MRFGVLGPLVVEDDRGPVGVGGSRHRAVLARLLLARGRVVPVETLVDDLWEEPPGGAVGAVRTFVAALRRALEPDRPPRAPARLLVTAPPGYALRAEAGAVDAWRFEAAVAEVGGLSAGAALARVEEALGWWRGPAYAEFADLAWARGEVARLDELRLLALERRAGALLELGRAAVAVPDLEAHVEGHPWREDAWRLLALALYRAGRQGDALGALRRAREGLAEALGVDPGPDLRRLEADILAHAPHLVEVGEEAPAGRDGGVARSAGRGDVPGLVGRDDELAGLGGAAERAVERRRPVLVLVSGDAGAGKTALAEAFAARLAARGWTTAWGANPDAEGLPAAWPWSQVLDTLAAAGHGFPAGDGETGGGEAGGGDPLVARFHRHRAVGAHLAGVARRAPLLLVLDDLHWAGEETLALLASVVTDSDAHPVLAIATYRTTDVPAALSDLLGRVARAEPTRVYLGGLPVAAVPDLVRATTGRDVDAATATAIHRRSGGNPFFVRELARLAAAEGPSWAESVPPGVRDVVRHRLASLPEPVREVLRRAAVVGADLDLELLAALAGPGVLDAAETATRRGFLVERGPGRFRFAHALVRDTLYQDVSGSRRARWHADTGEVLERLRPDAVDALAHHFLLAESPGTDARAAHYARAAAERAERHRAPHEAARLWRAALAAHDRAAAHDHPPAADHHHPPAGDHRAGDHPLTVDRPPAVDHRAGDHPSTADHPSAADRRAGDPATRLELVMGMVRTQAVTGDLDRARRHRAEALALADGLGDPELTARVIAAFDVPAVWTDHDDPTLAHRIAEITERTLAALPPDRTATRSRLLATLALELRATGGDRARAAAREAEALARESADPAVLAFALNARFMQSFHRAGLAPDRARTGAELVDLARRHDLVTFEVLGHLVLLQAHSALADFATADHHAAAADRLGEDHRLPLVGVFTRWYRALRTGVTGQGAEAAYRAAAARLAGTGMSGVDEGILPFALLCHRLQRGERPDPDPDTGFGAYEPWCRPLFEPGADVPDSPRDLLYEARTCLHATIAVRRADLPAAERLHADLEPAADELAGAGSGMLTLRPVAHHLGDLARALGRHRLAADHYRHALAVAERAGAPHWAAAARTALDRPVS
ncbi:BTAD domain-containing putative transcriptional regulator [Saccharothrix xinjiangensis]|uniref:BTAD domain-containing putative transcriptional regulator n=1 Tax=Saccharothrix xinjiangensis TaxID=204798 RepID=A0ABV9Y7E9_9PSEU